MKHNRIWISLILIGSIGLIILNLNRQAIDSQAALATELTLDGKYPQAVEVYEQLLEKAPKDPLLWSQLTEVYRNMARYDEALASINAALNIQPENLTFLMTKAQIFESMDLQLEADSIYVDMLSLALPTDTIEDLRALSSLGHASYRLGNYDRAIAFYNRALEIEPENQTMLNQLAWTYMANKSYHQAILTFNKAIQYDPEDSLNFVNLGDCYYEMNNVDMAISQYKRALDLDAQSELANLKLASCYEKLSKLTLVVKYLEKHLENDPYDYYEYARLVRLYTDMERYEDAFDVTQRLIRVNPDDPYAYELQANTLYLMDNMVDVEEALNKMNQHVTERERLYNIGRWFMENGEFEFATKYIHQCLLKFPMDIEAYHTMAELYEATGRTEDIDWLFDQIADVFNEETALNEKFRHYSTHDQENVSHKIIDICSRLVELKPRNSDYWIRLGNAYAFNDELEASTITFEAMMEQFPNLYEPYYYRGLNRFNSQAYETAYEDFVTAASMNTSDAYLYYRFAECSAILGRNSEALKHLRTAVQINPSLENRLADDPHLNQFMGQL